MATYFVMHFVCVCVAGALICFGSEASRRSEVKEALTCERPGSSSANTFLLANGRRATSSTPPTASKSAAKLVLGNDRIFSVQKTKDISSPGSSRRQDFSSTAPLPAVKQAASQRSSSTSSLSSGTLRTVARNLSIAPQQDKKLSRLSSTSRLPSNHNGGFSSIRWSQGDPSTRSRASKSSKSSTLASGVKPQYARAQEPQTFASLRSIVESVFPVRAAVEDSGLASKDLGFPKLTLDGFVTCFRQWANEIRWTESAGSGRVVMTDRERGANHNVWLHWEHRRTILQIYVGDEQGAFFDDDGDVCHSDQYTGAKFHISERSGGPIAALERLGELYYPFAEDSILKSIAKFGTVFTEWQIELLSILRIPILEVSDSSFFGDPSDKSIETMPLKLLQKGMTLYQGFYGPAFSFVRDQCNEYLSNIRRMIRESSEPKDLEARAMAETVMTLTKDYSKSQDQKSKTAQWKEATELYKSLLASESDLVKAVKAMLAVCKSFIVKVPHAMELINNKY